MPTDTWITSESLDSKQEKKETTVQSMHHDERSCNFAGVGTPPMSTHHTFNTPKGLTI